MPDDIGLPFRPIAGGSMIDKNEIHQTLNALWGAVGFAFLIWIGPSQVDAQAVTEGGGVVGGLAIDSIHGRPLAGAVVRVVGTDLSSVSDASGRFRISQVPSGSYRLEVIHALLDTIGIVLETAPRQSTGKDSIFLVVSTPSPATLVSRKCSADEVKQGAAMAVGIVTDAGTQDPSSGAEVSVEWTDYELGAKSINRTPQKRSTLVKPDGSYRICGIPADLETGVFASRGNDTTAALLTNFGPRVSILSFQLSPASKSSFEGRAVGDRNSSGEVDSAGVAGRIVDLQGNAIGGARVSTDDDAAVTISRADGSFRISGLRPGTRALVVRRLGFQPARRPVEISGGLPSVVEIALARFVPILETIRISALRELGLERVGFASRKKSGAGRFISPIDLERRNSPRLNDILATVPSLRAGRTSEGQRYVTGRFGDCVRYFVDGRLWSDFGEGPDTFISGGEMGAVEVYSALSAPAEFSALGRDGRTCAIVVIWTKWKLRI